MLRLSWALLLLLLSNVSASVLYVNVDSVNPTPPFTNWSTAAVTIQQAVDAADTDDTVLVSNGVYRTGGTVLLQYGALTNRVSLTKPLTLESVNGPTVTAIEGYQPPAYPNGDSSSVRCVYLANSATVVGFTLTNGWPLFNYNTLYEGGGGGAWCQDPTAVLSNCVIIANRIPVVGGTLNNCHVVRNMGGARNATINQSLMVNNTNTSGGGARSCTLNGCGLFGNYTFGDEGGGANDCTLTNCILLNNACDTDGGGAFGCALDHCTLFGNWATFGGGASSCQLVNCLIVSNSTSSFGGGVENCTLSGCTIVGNSCGGGGGGGASSCDLTNCIVYYNSALDYGDNYRDGTFDYCCTVPLPDSGLGNITNAPSLISLAVGNFRLQTNSPCIDAGDTTYAVDSTDLDGRPRIVGGTVDIGAYEFQGPGIGEFIGWLQQYGLPTDGSADFIDTDGDGMNNWQEWICGTDPTNPLSVLKLLSPALNSGPSGLSITWQSVSNRTYYLQRSPNLFVQPAFTSIESNIVGQVSTTSFTDTNATGAGPYFYRVGVEKGP